MGRYGLQGELGHGARKGKGGMITTSTRDIRVTYNGQDITTFIADGFQRAIEDELRRKADEIMEQAKQPPPRVLSFQPFSATLHMTFVRVRSTAPIGACLWRRNLDGGNWRKRGHPAHRRQAA